MEAAKKEAAARVAVIKEQEQAALDACNAAANGQGGLVFVFVCV